MATNVTALLPEDRDLFHDFICDIIDVDAASPAITADTRAVVKALDLVLRDSQDVERRAWALRVRAALAEDGTRSQVDNVRKAKKTVFHKPNPGAQGVGAAAPLTIPARVGVKFAGERAYQQPLWWDLTWGDFAGYLANMEKRLARQEEKVEAFRFVSSLRAKYPETATPGEALRRDGIDPQSIDLAA